MEFKWTTELTEQTYRDALAIRKNVFVDEQNVSLDEEIDDFEDKCQHTVGYIDGEAAATGRILPLDNKSARFQRIAIEKKHRGFGYGRDLVLVMVEQARILGYTDLELHAQDYAIPFYEKLGFTVEGKGFMDANIPHHNMVLTI